MSFQSQPNPLVDDISCLHRVDSKAVKLIDVSKQSTMVSSDSHSEVQEPTYILAWRINQYSRPVQVLLCATALFSFYVLYGYLQELIFRLPGMQPFGWYLTLVQFAIYSILGFGELSLDRTYERRKVPISVYLQLALYTVGTMGFSNSSLGYLNYPTQVIFKCCKLIPVLIGGILIQGKRYGILDFIAAVLMSGGLIMFVLADNQVSPVFNIKGYALISSALIFDAIIGNVQEKQMKHHGGGNSEMVFYSYFIGCVYILIGLVVSGQFWDAFLFFAQHPYETYGYAMLFSIAGYLGVNIVLTLVKQFGAFLAVTVTTCRKAVTIILSFVFFAKPFTFQYVTAGCIVLLGIYLNVYNKNREKFNAQFVSIMKRLATKIQQRKGPVRSDFPENIV